MSAAPTKGVLKGLAQEARTAVESELPTRDAAHDSLLTRHEAAMKMESIKLIRTELVDPALCRPSAQNARNYDQLTKDNCEDLIESIRTEGTQHTAALVRPTGDPSVPYEIVTGSRRHFAVSWLRGNNYPHIGYLIEIRELSDEAAFRLSDEENRARKDVTDWERAGKYAAALKAFYDGSVTAMAQRLAISVKTLRRYLALSELPNVVVEAYGGQECITVSHARAISPELAKSLEAQRRIIDEAGVVAAEQAQLRNDGSTLIAPPAVFARLVKATKSGRGSAAAGRSIAVKDREGNELFSYTAPTKAHGLTLKVSNKFAGSSEELVNAVTKVLDDLYSRP